MRLSRPGLRRRHPVTVETWSKPRRDWRKSRIWQLCLVNAVLAVILAIALDPLGRAVLIIVAIMLGELALGKACVFLLYRIGEAFGETDGFISFARTTLATLSVLTVTTLLMFGLFIAGILLMYVTAV